MPQQATSSLSLLSADFLKLSPDAVVVCDLDGRVIDWNGIASLLYGWTQDAALGAGMDLLLRTEPAARAAEAHEGVLRDGHWRGELTRSCQDGRRVVVRARRALLRNSSGVAVAILETARDITLRRERQEVDRLLASMVESSQDAILSKTLDGTITSWNHGAQLLYGYSAEEAIGRSVAMLMPPERPDEFDSIMQRLRRGERIEHEETERVAKDGRRRLVSVTISPLRGEDDRIVGASSVARDITAQKRDEARVRFLSEASALLATTLDYEVTLARVAQLAVPEFADWTSVNILEDDGSVRRVAMAHADPGRTAWLRELEERRPLNSNATAGVSKVIQTGKPEFYPEVREDSLERREHQVPYELRLTSTMIVPLQARERTLGALTLAYAGSTRRYAEDDLRFAQELAGRAAQAVDNARLYRDAVAALHVRDDFLGSVSHDLRTPLTTIRGSVQLALRRLNRDQPVDRESMSSLLSSADDAGGRMAAMIDSLLDLSRLQSGRPLELAREEADLVAMVQRLVNEHQRGSARHRIRFEFEPEAIVGAWDPTRLERALANLISNAVKYSPDGGEILIRAAVETGSQVPAASVMVEDHGIGIPAAELPSVFERFHRASNVPPGVPGVGIGLAGAKQIIEQHGGSLTVESEEGAGSRFTAYVPLQSTEQG